MENTSKAISNWNVDKSSDAIQAASERGKPVKPIDNDKKDAPIRINAIIAEVRVAPSRLSINVELDSEPCDAAPEELAVAEAIDRLQNVVDFKVQAVERKWAGLRSFAPDRLPIYGWDPPPRRPTRKSASIHRMATAVPAGCASRIIATG